MSWPHSVIPLCVWRGKLYMHAQRTGRFSRPQQQQGHSVLSHYQYKPLHLMAADERDLELISAALQDSVLKIGDMAYLPDDRRFAFVANRFVWELATGRKRGVFARVRTGIHFNDIIRVQQRNLRPDARSAVIDLLAIRLAPGREANGDGHSALVRLDLTFAGGGLIRLDAEAINVELHDLSEPWPTRARPDHEQDMTAATERS